MVKVTNKDREDILTFIVVPGKVQTILGLSACERLNLVNRGSVVENKNTDYDDELMSKYSDLFQDNLLENTQSDGIKMYHQSLTHVGKSQLLFRCHCNRNWTGWKD